MDWRDQCREKLIAAQQAAKLIQSGQRVLIGLGTVEPQWFREELRAAARKRFWP